jgi:YHS domain-containing protein
MSLAVTSCARENRGGCPPTPHSGELGSMLVSPVTAAWRCDTGAGTACFCSAQCVAMFGAEPARYAAHAG